MKAAEIWVQDAGNGTMFYKIVTAGQAISVQVNDDKGLYAVTCRGPLSFSRHWRTAKYGDPVEVTPAQ